MPTNACPDCPDDGDMHAASCPRVNSCGQIGPPYLPPPFHPWPDLQTMGDTDWLVKHAADVHGVQDFQVRI